MFDVEDRRHRQKLDELLLWIRERNEEIPHPNWEPFMDAMRYAIDQLDKNAAARILARNKGND